MDSLDLNDIDVSVATSHLSALTSGKQLDTTATNGNSTKHYKCITNSAASGQIRSSAVVQYSASKYPTLFTQLAPKTNINLAPSNWLRRAAGLRPNILISGSRSQSPTIDMTRKVTFSSLIMADSHIEMMGNVDVVSDAENIKKLLKAPYSKAHISMAVHRVGKTLLLEQFNVTKDLDQQQEWFRFVCSVLPHGQQNMKKKLPSAQLNRLMLSKFLYYSLTEENGQENSQTLTAESSQHVCHSQISDNNTDIARLDDYKGASKIHVRETENRWNYWTPADFLTRETYDVKDKFERTILWTFEDLQMLLGTNMPIFGGGEYPAVSLRLFDSKKPINILTGIDYWLDNLICNVPEVVMCFHVNGIVQNYEVIKTEEIPKLENSKFNPQVIKDIAQSILSFLKSNCTKEGHTYWLFKGSNDDVVKLYDLTMLYDSSEKTCDEMCSDLSNPFTIPVASLLYKMATNLLQEDGFSKHNVTVKRLLKNCIGLLENKVDVEPIMLASALEMLSALFLSNYNDSLRFYEKTLHDVDGSFSMLYDRNDPLQPKDKLPLQKETKSTCHTDKEHTLFCENGTNALTFCLRGLRVFQCCTKNSEHMSAQMCGDIMVIHTKIVRNMVVAYFEQAIRTFSCEEHGITMRHPSGLFSWCLYLLQLAQYILEYWEQLNAQCTKSSLTAKVFFPGMYDGKPHHDLKEIFANTLAMCGDIKLNILQNKNHQNYWKSFNQLTNEDIEIKQILRENFAKVGEKYKDITRISECVEQTLASCRNCYQLAFNHLKSYKTDEVSNDKTTSNEGRLFESEAKQTLKPKCGSTKFTKKQDISSQQLFLTSVSRKLGHVANEQGALELSKAVDFLQQVETDAEDEKAVWKLCFSHFEAALLSFKLASDNTNQALVLSNLGKLMRICAQSVAQTNNNTFTIHEQHLYEKALEYYQKALTSQRKVKDCKQTVHAVNCRAPSVQDNISWELSSTYFFMAKRMQDHAPIGVMSQDEIEQKIVEIMNKSLKNCCAIWKKTQKQDLPVLRCGEIHARLASLHHNAFQQSVIAGPLPEGDTYCFHFNDSGKRQHLKTLAENHYNKACTYYEQLLFEQPTALLRVKIERVALQEQFITRITSSSKKLKAITDGFNLLWSCVKPLNVIISTLQVTDDSTSIEPARKSCFHKSTCQTLDSIEEWHRLSEILNKIILSLLLLFLKTAPTSLQTSTKKPHVLQKQTNTYSFCKNIYARTLRCNTIGTEERKTEFLLKKMESLQEIIQDLETQNIS